MRVDVDLAAGTADGRGHDTIDGVGRVIGSAFADEIRGDGQDNVLIGLGGADLLAGAAGSDDVFPDSHDDIDIPSDRADDVVGSGGEPGPSRDRVYPEGGGDVIVGGDGQDIVRGVLDGGIVRTGVGYDTIQARGAWTGYGGPDRDIISGGVAGVRYGGPGDDLMRGGPGSDHLFGGLGDDRIDGAGGDDTADGGRGDDECVAETVAHCESRAG